MTVKLCILLFTLMTSLTSLGQVQRGKATFYGKKATGRMTANGERLHHDSMTCAHRTYPFGTKLLVTNLQNKRQVVVRVTDRGPFAPGRIIDLSYGAARELGILSQGVASVTVEQYLPVQIPYRLQEHPAVPVTPDTIQFSFYIPQFSVLRKPSTSQSQQPQTH